MIIDTMNDARLNHDRKSPANYLRTPQLCNREFTNSKLKNFMGLYHEPSGITIGSSGMGEAAAM
jgi:hypothetical protein